MTSHEEYNDDMDVDSVEGEGEEDLSGSAIDPQYHPSLLSPQVSVDGQTPSRHLQWVLTLPQPLSRTGSLFKA